MARNNRPTVRFFRRRDGATTMMGERRAEKLRREIEAGRGGETLADLTLGHSGFMVAGDDEEWPIDAMPHYYGVA